MKLSYKNKMNIWWKITGFFRDTKYHLLEKSEIISNTITLVFISLIITHIGIMFTANAEKSARTKVTPIEIECSKDLVQMDRDVLCQLINLKLEE